MGTYPVQSGQANSKESAVCMTNEKNHNVLCWLKKISLLICILVAILTGSSWIVIQITAATTQIEALQAQQENSVSEDLFNAHLQLWDKRFQIMEKQLTRIERLLLEQKK